MEFKFLGGHPALDFINTVGGRTHTSASRYTVDRERLEAPSDLDAFWSAAAAAAAFKSGGRSRRSARADLERAIELREALYRIFKAVIAKCRPEMRDVAILNRASSGQKLTFNGAVASFTADDPLGTIARSAAELLTSPEIARVRACGGESCGWLFLDTSRNRSRQWCDMADCGNVAKVRRFRDRQRESG
jgi:predicted RNA-binding Zn ribbon-like protein